MESTLGIIAPSYEDRKFGNLTFSRNTAMLPMGCRYRIIDFPLSSMTNYGINNVAIYTGKKVRSHMDHLAMGAPWNLNRRFQGLFLFPPIVTEDQINKYGEMAEFKSTENHLERSKEKYVLYVRPEYLTKVDLDDVYRKFIKEDADIAMVYRPINDTKMEYLNLQQLLFDEEGRFTNIGGHFGTKTQCNLYMNMFLMKKEVFQRLINLAMERGDISTMEDAIFHYRNDLKVIGYEYNGVFEVIRDPKSYYEANMRLLDKEYFDEVFNQGARIYTKAKDEPSSIYMPTSEVKNSLFANGCQIAGTVENSVVFRSVKIEEGAVVKNSVIMQKCTIKAGSVVVNSILDKNVYVGKGQNLMGSLNQPYIIEKNSVIAGEEG